MRALAEQFKNQSDVWLEVWNEPYTYDNSGGYSNATWLKDAIEMVENLRSVEGFDNIIVVPGNGQVLACRKEKVKVLLFSHFF